MNQLLLIVKAKANPPYLMEDMTIGRFRVDLPEGVSPNIMAHSLVVYCDEIVSNLIETEWLEFTEENYERTTPLGVPKGEQNA